MKYIVLLVLTSVFFARRAYDPAPVGDLRFKFVNLSNSDIFCYVSTDTSYSEIASQINENDQGSEKFIFPVEFIRVNDTVCFKGVSVWEGFVNGNCQDSAINVFIFDKNQVDRFGWDYVVSNKKILKQYRFREAELVENSWIIKFAE